MNAELIDFVGALAERDRLRHYELERELECHNRAINRLTSDRDNIARRLRSVDCCQLALVLGLCVEEETG